MYLIIMIIFLYVMLLIFVRGTGTRTFQITSLLKH
jgi:hypothetical protein